MRSQKLPFRTIFMISLLAFFNNELLARPTTTLDAENVVTGLLQLDANPLGMPLGNQVVRVEAFTDEAHKPIYYVVYLKLAGFVIVPADEHAVIAGVIAIAKTCGPNQTEWPRTWIIQVPGAGSSTRICSTLFMRSGCVRTAGTSGFSGSKVQG